MNPLYHDLTPPGWKSLGSLNEFLTFTAGIPTEEQAEQLHQDIFIVMSPDRKTTIDLGWYPDSDSNGAFTIFYVENEDWDEPTASFNTRSIGEAMRVFAAWIFMNWPADGGHYYDHTAIAKNIRHYFTEKPEVTCPEHRVFSRDRRKYNGNGYTFCEGCDKDNRAERSWDFAKLRAMNWLRNFADFHRGT